MTDHHQNGTRGASTASGMVMANGASGSEEDPQIVVSLDSTPNASASAALRREPSTSTSMGSRKRRRGERAFLIVFAPICVASFFAARSFGRQLRAAGYAASVDSTYNALVSMMPASSEDLFGTATASNRPSLMNFTISQGIANSSAIRKVYILPQVAPNPLAAGELKHFMQDAVTRSSRLVETHDRLDPEALWLYDPIRLNWNVAVEVVKNTTHDRLEHIRQQMRNTGLDEAAISERGIKVPPWEFYIIDYNDDGFSFIFKLAKEIMEAMGSDVPVVRAATRKHTNNRGLDVPKNETTPFAPLGEAIDYANHKQLRYLYGVPRILRYGVRSDLVDFMEKEYDGTFYEAVANATGRKLIDLIPRDRPTDVFHPWRPGTDLQHGKHRTGIAQMLQTMEYEYAENGTRRGLDGNYTRSERKLTMILSPMGRRSRPGRNSVQKEYVDTLTSTKIVVTSQRDRWEDHYRLMEALATGALVMTDPMSSLPRYLEDGESLVVYHSLSELKEKLLHYLDHDDERLAIARKGHWIAMNHHRSWHGLERIIFGDWTKPMGR